MNTLKNLFVPSAQNNYSPIATKSLTILIFALVVLFFNIAYSVNPGQVSAAISISDIVTLHNQERQSRGLSTLRIDTKLNQSAQNKAEAMLESDCWSHYCPDGKSPWEFFDESGYEYIYAGENLAHGFNDSESVMTAWMNSPTHRENILKSEFDEIGIGIAYGDFQGKSNNIIIAVHFGKENDSIESLAEVDPTPVQGAQEYKPSIISPKDGEYLNDNLTKVIGTAPKSNKVEIYNNSNLVGEIPVDGGIFTYRPVKQFKEGENILYIKSFINQENVQDSDEVNFVVDTTVPYIIKDSLKVSNSDKLEPTIILSLQTSETLSQGRFIINNVSYEFLNSSNLNWRSEILVESLKSVEQFEVYIEDLAGNGSTTIYKKSDLAGIDDIIDTVSDRFYNSDSKNEAGMFLGLSESKLKSQINLIFVFISLAVISIDFIAAKQTGLTGFSGKSHFHFSNFIVLLFIILIGGLNGHLLEGLSK